MTATKVLSRDWTFEINTGTIAVPVWTVINGINSHSPGRSKENADDVDYNNAGIISHVPAAIEYSLELEGFWVEDDTTGTRDAGQEACETLSDGLGSAGIKQFRFTSPAAGSDAKIARGSCEAGPAGGGNDDMTGWECKITFIEKPV